MISSRGAERAGEPIDKTLLDRLANILKLSLRSDYPRLLGGEELRERVEALAALAEGGKLDDSYVAELSRRADFLPNDSVARIGRGRRASAERRSAHSRRADRDDVEPREIREPQWRCRSMRDRRRSARRPIILPSETRSLAEMLRAAALAAPSDPRAPVLRDALLRLGEGDGWGTTNANAARDRSAGRRLAAARSRRSP